MRHIVAFSGGYDSTYLLTRMCRDSAFNKDEIVAVTLIQNLTGESKLRREHESRILILEYLRKKYPEVHLNSVEIVIEVPWYLSSYKRSGVGCPQPILWLNNILPILGDDDKVYLSYIRGDDALCFNHEMSQIWSNGCKITGSKAELIFPIRYIPKEQVLIELIQDYPDLIEYCTSCEDLSYNGRKKVCGRCVPCQHLRTALASIVTDPRVVLGVRMTAKQMLKDKFDIEISTDVIDKYDQEEVSISSSRDKAVETTDESTAEEVEIESGTKDESEESEESPMPAEAANDLEGALQAKEPNDSYLRVKVGDTVEDGQPGTAIRGKVLAKTSSGVIIESEYGMGFTIPANRVRIVDQEEE